MKTAIMISSIRNARELRSDEVVPLLEEKERRLERPDARKITKNGRRITAILGGSETEAISVGSRGKESTSTRREAPSVSLWKYSISRQSERSDHMNSKSSRVLTRLVIVDNKYHDFS